MGLKTEHKHSMDAFYSDKVHTFINSNYEKALRKYRKRVFAELEWMRIRPEEMKGKVVFDMGTGYQSIVFAELGCRRIYHVDINHSQVKWLKEYCSENGITSITTECHDVMESVGEVRDLDLAFLVGVYHHLHCPPTLIRHLMERSVPGTRYFIRCYRSGTWSRWLTAHLRNMSALLSIDDVLNAVDAMFPMEKKGQFTGDLIDDLFVPVWGCFHPKQFINDAKVLGMECRNEGADYDWDHGCRDENFRIRLEAGAGVRKSEDNITPEDLETSRTIDQTAMDFGDAGYVKRNTLLFNEFNTIAREMDPFELSCRLVTLYRMVRNIGQMDYLNLAALPDRNNDHAGLSERRHEALSGILERWCLNNSNINGFNNPQNGKF